MHVIKGGCQSSARKHRVGGGGVVKLSHAALRGCRRCYHTSHVCVTEILLLPDGQLRHSHGDPAGSPISHEGAPVLVRGSEVREVAHHYQPFACAGDGHVEAPAVRKEADAAAAPATLPPRGPYAAQHDAVELLPL